MCPLAPIHGLATAAAPLARADRLRLALDAPIDAFWLLDAVRDGDGRIVDFRESASVPAGAPPAGRAVRPSPEPRSVASRGAVRADRSPQTGFGSLRGVTLRVRPESRLRRRPHAPHPRSADGLRLSLALVDLDRSKTLNDTIGRDRVVGPA